MVWSATRFGPLPPCSLMIAAIYYDIYIRGGDGVLLNGAHRKGESPGNILSKTTSSGMTNDEYTGSPNPYMHIPRAKAAWREGRDQLWRRVDPKQHLEHVDQAFSSHLSRGETDLKKK